MKEKLISKKNTKDLLLCYESDSNPVLYIEDKDHWYSGMRLSESQAKKVWRFLNKVAKKRGWK